MATATLEPLVESDPLIFDKPHDEVIGGVRVETPRMGTYETEIASILQGHFFSYCLTRGIGRAVTEMLFRLDESGDLKRRPDMAFVTYERWPKARRPGPKSGWAVAPDLAVEVVSDSNTAAAVVAKVREYFEHGVRLVWVVYPDEAMVYVYDSPLTIRVIDREGRLDGGEVIPGFSLPMATLFETEDDAARP